MVQQLAAHALADGSHHLSLEALAGIGCYGLYKGNCNRDLTRRCCAGIWNKMPLPYNVRVPIVNEVPGEPDVVHINQEFILPHELFASVAAYSAELWQFLLGNAAELQEWWQSDAERALNS